MGKIIIFSDDSFESVSAAKPTDLKGHQERVKELKRDVSIATKIAGKQRALKKQHDAWLVVRQSTAHPKKAEKLAALSTKVKALRADIKELKADLSSSRHADLDKAHAALTKAQQAKADHSKKHLPRNQKTSRAGDSDKVQRSEKNASAAYDRERKELMTRFNQIGMAVEAAKRKVTNARTADAKDKAAKELKALEKSYNSTRIALTRMKPSPAARAKEQAANERSKKAALRVHRKQVDSDKRKAAEYGRDVKLGLRDSR